MPRVAAPRLEIAVKKQRPPASDPLSTFIQSQLCKLREEAPATKDWVHELKYDGYRIHARIDRGAVALLTRSGLDWTYRYEATAAFLAAFPCERAYIDGELCALDDDGQSSFAAMQAASDNGASQGLVYFAFDRVRQRRRATAGRETHRCSRHRSADSGRGFERETICQFFG